MAKKKSLRNHVQSKRTGWKYEGKQYTGGRVEGRKNLKKLESGNVQNVHGIVFTPEESIEAMKFFAKEEEKSEK